MWMKILITTFGVDTTDTSTEFQLLATVVASYFQKEK